MAVAPTAILALFDAIHAHLATAVDSGVVGDRAHSFGYHLARTDLPRTDYSVTLARDQLGAAGNASALDISLNPALMITVTNRLLTAAKAGDPRLAALRSFCGTTDGKHTHPYDLSNRQDGPLDSWDDSHLWHVHLSIYREYADNLPTLLPIADVIAGIPLPVEFHVTPADQKTIQSMLDTMKAKLEDDLIHRMLNDENGHPHLVDAYIHEVEARLSQSESRIILAVIAAIKAAK